MRWKLANFSLRRGSRSERSKPGSRKAGCCPAGTAKDRRFSDVDLARAQLIRDLGELGVNDDGIPVILDLVDQLHGLRRMLRDLLSTIHAQPDAARRRMLSDIDDIRTKARGRT